MPVLFIFYHPAITDSIDSFNVFLCAKLIPQTLDRNRQSIFIHIFCAICPDPVSYTHLDVYKRQPERSALVEILSIGIPVMMQDGFIQVSFIIITIIANHRGLTDAAAVGIVEKIISFLFLVPSSMLSTVSALDVYKRQILNFKIGISREPPELKHLSRARKRHQTRFRK